MEQEDDKMDLQALFTMSYGLYVVSSADGERRSGCIVNTLTQVTAEPPRLVVAVNKDNVTTEIIRKAGRFTGVALGVGAGMELIGRFGFRSGRDLDKFDGIPYGEDESGIPYPTEHAVARFSCRVIGETDLGTHVLFVGELTEAERLLDEEPMTYAYYHQVKKGLTPKNASSYNPTEKAAVKEAPKKESWRCTICGYVHEGPLPEDFTCPVCGVGAELFEKEE